MESADGSNTRRLVPVEWGGIIAFVIGCLVGGYLGITTAEPPVRTDGSPSPASELQLIAREFSSLADRLPDHADGLRMLAGELSGLAGRSPDHADSLRMLAGELWSLADGLPDHADSLRVLAEGASGVAGALESAAEESGRIAEEHLTPPQDEVPSVQELLRRSPEILWAFAILGAAWAAPRTAAKIQRSVAERLKEDDAQASERLAATRAWDDVELLATLVSSGFAFALLLTVSVKNDMPVLIGAGIIASLVLGVTLVALVCLRRRYSKKAV